MLYEVITLASVELEEQKGLRLTTHITAVDPTEVSRITSYNVCYTKLLRAKRAALAAWYASAAKRPSLVQTVPTP